MEKMDGPSPPADTLRVNRIEPAYRQVADQLRTLILRGELQLGERLPTEPELSTTFGVSRSTVREALRILASQNLISSKRGITGGTFVSRPEPHVISGYLKASLGLLSDDDVGLEEFLEAREILEVPVARLAAERRTQRQVELMRASIAQSEADVGMGQHYEGNINFHAVLIEAAHNPLLELMVGPIFEVLRTRFLRDRVPPNFWQEVAFDHRALVDAIERRDPQAAAEASREHLRKLRPAYAQIDRKTVDSPDAPGTDPESS